MPIYENKVCHLPFHNGLKDNIAKVQQKFKTRKRRTLFFSQRPAESIIGQW